ncbi:CLAVATA3/ESR (CLE)-related protein 1 [Dendrobium catenatum]|uniref:CLAVATA3/ESR (CLE)-related protein 1 n=1 Tax=Dendrobium catenatum TaxID=906689 RepID=A0A2I0VXJ9_9ASPA|nr:CLAVATA3/ESR (CLE)-related protein 1 [Dendrobium catenatum]
MGRINILKFLLWCIFLITSSLMVSSEPRLVKEKQQKEPNKRYSTQQLNKVAMFNESNRLSPGGPDPEHH